jgi:ankyrin repeat protein
LCTLQQGADKEATNGYFLTTPLHHAAGSGHLEVVDYLLDQGLDRDKPNKYLWTPLHLAAVNDHLEVVQCLMSYGADINAKNDVDETPLDVAATEEIKQAIRDVEQQRYEANFGKKRIPEADLRPPPPPTKIDEDEDVDEEEDESSGDD